MQVYEYSFDPVALEYTRKSLATPNPLVPDQYLLSAYSTLNEPPVIKTHQAAVYDLTKDTWHVVADYRDTTYWLADGSVHVITALGEEPPAGALLTQPPGVSAALKREKLLAIVASKRYEIETGGLVLPNGVRVGTDREDQAIITGAVSAAQLGIAEYDWKGVDGAWIKLKADEITKIGAAVAMHVQGCFSAERRHCEAIAATPDDQLDGYDIDVGWPV